MVFESDFTRIERTVSRCRPPSKLPGAVASGSLSAALALAIAAVQVRGAQNLPAMTSAVFWALAAFFLLIAGALAWKSRQDDRTFAMDIQVAVDEIKELRSRFVPRPIKIIVEDERPSA